MRIAVLVKQIPKFEAMALRSDGRLQRDGVELEYRMVSQRNAPCRLYAEKILEYTVIVRRAIGCGLVA